MALDEVRSEALAGGADRQRLYLDIFWPTVCNLDGVPDQWITLKGCFSVVIWFDNDVTVLTGLSGDKMSS